MSKKDYLILLQEAKEKVNNSFALVDSSISKLDLYDLNKEYSFTELEPYDALSDRFIRCVEVFIKFFKTYDSYKSVAKADTYRDLINFMAKLSLISDVELWIRIRNIRNRIVHDYLPEQRKEIFDSIMKEFYEELRFCKKKIDSLNTS